jgi:hypothetical protein
MEPDDLLCSRNARSRTPLVGRAQWKISQPPSLRITSELGGNIDIVRRAQLRIDQATLMKGNRRTGRGEGSGQTVLSARRAPTIKLWSLGARNGDHTSCLVGTRK